ncbi:AraC family transcriptional regulator [Acinetobacter sp. ANC 4648]|uniref:AraC family transcriptional regulator n=1 Tax=Acinetobacter sp. ANC 4648 TaxID=1977875 RepID=UPI00148A822B|nr:AraC family transcriptional regulator [Acinetobacter sp. ANC 4648]
MQSQQRLSISAQLAVSEAQHWMNNICGKHELIVPRQHKLNFQHQYARLSTSSDALSFGYIQYGTDVGIVNAKTLRCYSLSLPLTGEQELQLVDSNIISNNQIGLIINPQEELQLNIAGDCKKLHIAIPKEKLEYVLKGLIGQDLNREIVFDPKMHIDTVQVSQWWQQIRFFLDDINLSGANHLHYFYQEMESLLIKKLLFIQPHNYSEQLKNNSGHNLPRELQFALQFIQQNSKLPIGLQDICDFSHSSATKLNLLFNKHFQISPIQYLKQIRLKNVFNELIHNPQNNIAEIAIEHGFNHLGHFSRDYKLLFNEKPSQTIKRLLIN